jgi:hypothetical protein
MVNWLIFNPDTRVKLFSLLLPPPTTVSGDKDIINRLQEVARDKSNKAAKAKKAESDKVLGPNPSTTQSVKKKP